MANDRLTAITCSPAGAFHHTIARCHDRCPPRRRPVHTGMHLAIAEDRMSTHPEWRCHAAGRYRIADQERPRASSLAVKVIHSAVRKLKAIESALLAVENCRHVKQLGGFARIAAW